MDPLIVQAANDCLKKKSFVSFVSPTGGRLADPNIYFSPDVIAKTFILQPHFVQTRVPDQIRDKLTKEDIETLELEVSDVTPTELVFLEVLGYTRWSEIRDLMVADNLDLAKISPTKLFFLKSVGVI